MAHSDCKVGGLGLVLFMIIVASGGPEPAGAAGVIDTGNVTCSPSVAGCPSGNLQVGNTADGTRTVDAVASGPFGNVTLGNNTGLSGTLDVINAGSFGTTGFLNVGGSGTGTLGISGAGSQLTITGASALTIGAGGNGTGSMTVSGGATASQGIGAPSASFVTVGGGAGSSGSLTVTGTGSQMTINNGLTVGFMGVGTLMVQSGGAVNVNGTFNGSLAVGQSPGSNGSSVTISGLGSQLNVLGRAAFVGLEGNATLNVQSGGALNAPRLGIAASATGVTGTVNVSGAGSQITLGGPTTFSFGGVFQTTIIIGFGGNGILDITNGGKVLAEPTVANHQASMNLGLVHTTTGIGGTGTVTVSGAGSELRIRGNTTPGSTLVGFIDVGQGDASFPAATTSGTLNVLNGGQVFVEAPPANPDFGGMRLGRLEGATGSVLVSGAGSHIGIAGNVFVGQKSATDPALANPGSGTLTVASGGSLAATNNMRVGNGTVTVSGGGQMTSGIGFIGEGAAHVGTVTVTGAGSRWGVEGPPAPFTDRNFMRVGAAGVGTLNVTGGGEVVIGGGTVPGAALQVGRAVGSVGTLNISGAGSRMEFKGVSDPATIGIGGVDLGSQAGIGWAGTGTLNIVNGGALVMNATHISTGLRDGAFFIGRDPGGVGTTTVSGTGSLLDVPGSIRIALGPGDAPGGTGALTVSSGGLVTATDVRVGVGGILNGAGGTIDGSVVNLGGIVAPGLSPGTLTILGDYTQLAGQLVLEIWEDGVADLLKVGGAFNLLGGTVDIQIDEDLNLAPGQTFDLLMAGSGTTPDVLTVVVSSLGALTVEGTGDLASIHPTVELVELNASVPAPASLALLALGMAGAALARARRQGRQGGHHA